MITGILLDRFSVRGVAGLTFFGQAIGILLLLGGLRWALPAAFLLGVAQGAEIDLLGFVVARRFGQRGYARVFGACFGISGRRDGTSRRDGRHFWAHKILRSGINAVSALPGACPRSALHG
jgi:hypothetical protein